MVSITLAPVWSLCSFLILGLLPYRTLAQGKLALYTDFECRHPSQIQPSISVPLSICIVPIGAVSIAVDQFPQCDGGSAANLVLYEDTSCARNTYSDSNTYDGWSDISNCFYIYITDSIPGIMFTCDDPATNPQPTSTSTITASIVAGVATGSPNGSKETTLSAANAAATTKQGSTSTSSSPAETSSASSSGLSTSDKIALYVGLGVGIPSILIALLAWCWPRR